jgi:hypothetical protein
MVAQQLAWTIAALPGPRRQNTAQLVSLTRTPDGRGDRPPQTAYAKRFAANCYHYARERIRLLALAHSTRFGAARRFERLLTARLPEWPIPGAASLAPGRPPVRQWRWSSRAVESHWAAPEVWSFLSAYGAVQQRREAEGAIATIFARVLP